MKLDIFIEKANLKHSNFYGYSLVPSEVRSHDHITILCPKHGSFTQRVTNHLSGKGCRLCADDDTKSRLMRGRFYHISRAQKKHSNFYTYEKIGDNVKITDIVEINCPSHGYFKQLFSNHINGNGCPTCYENVRGDIRRKPTSEHIEDCIAVHGEKYDYSDFPIDVLSTDRVSIRCPIHGHFEQVLDAHKAGCGCGDCVNMIKRSKGEQEILDFIKSFYDGEIRTNDRNSLNGKELDIYLPEIGRAIEFDGLYWHSEQFKDRNHQISKIDAAKEKNIKIVFIFEDEWKYKKDIVKSKLRYFVGMDKRDRVYGRETTVDRISKKEKREFLNKFHIQGDGPSSLDFGLFDGNNLIGVGSFLSTSVAGSYILNRYATKCLIAGGMDKIVSAFLRTCPCDELVSFADLRYSDGRVYEASGWTLIGKSRPDYSYVFSGRRQHKFSFRRKYLNKKLKSFDPGMSEHQNCLTNGVYRIYDAGKLKFKYNII